MRPDDRARIAIIGAAGYAAGDLLRLLLRHGRARVVQAISSSAAGRPVAEVHPNLLGLTDLTLTDRLDPASPVEVVVFCGRHGDAMEQLPPLVARAPSLRVVDLSGDFRLQDPALYPRWYDREHRAPDLLPTFAYGLPELFRDRIQGASRISNPGCFATAIILALAPAARAGLPGPFTATAITGSSGSGARSSARTHHPTRASTLRAYRPLRHQHTPEILQALQALSGAPSPEVNLVPLSGPFVRGIYAVCQAPLPTGWSARQLEAAYEAMYGDEPFIRLGRAPPDLQVVVGSNFCDLFVGVEGDRAVFIAGIDNLVKGAAGQAVQNLNLAMGWPESEGLDLPGAYP